VNRCHSIAAGAPFARTLAEWLFARYGVGGALVNTLVLLPNRRACLALREAFLEVSGGKPRRQALIIAAYTADRRYRAERNSVG
jgi:hypothetical protein